MARIAQISDCHLFADPKHMFNGVATFESLCTVLDQVRNSLPDGIIVTGDISADDSVESYANFLAAMDTHCPGIPFRVIPGNHDNNPNFDALLKGYVLNAKSAWSLHNVNVLGLDTRYKASNGHIRATELFDIHTQLLKNANQPHIVVMHHPPFALDGWMQAHECNNHQIMLSWLAKQSNIVAVVHGHLHCETANSLSGISVLGCPSTSWQYKMGSEYGLAEESAGFRLIEINASTPLTSDVVRVA